MDPFKELYQPRLIEGYCKKENTEQYFERIFKHEIPRNAYTELDSIKISRLGFGSYRIARGNPVFEKSLEQSILNGVNLIDTSSNYGDGSSESLIGDVLKRLVESSKIKREEVFIVTKIGYIQGRNMLLVEEKEKEGNGFTDLTYYDANCFHSISPDFLQDQLERARKRLGLAVIDAVLLHNPEYFLMDREHHNISEEKAKADYYTRIEKAFEFLESMRQTGIIRYYGVSSNTFPKEETSYTHTSLSRLIIISERIRETKNLPDSGFRIIQFPANIYETDFILEKNNQNLSVVEFAKQNKIFTLLNRPLNAMKKKGGMDRLAIYTGKDLEKMELNLAEFTSDFKIFEEKIFNSLGIEKQEFTFISVIELYKDKFNNIEHYHQALNHSIIPGLKKILVRVDKLDKTREFYETYLKKLNDGILKLENYIEAKSSSKMKPLLGKLQKLDLSLEKRTLSQSSVLCLLSFSGVNSVLVGMRRENYVYDMLPLLSLDTPKISEKDFMNLEI